MCSPACIEFAASVLTREIVEDQDVLEVGALDVNGSVRPLVEALNPATYLGVDISEGARVDEICSVEDLVSRYGENRFGVVVSTELVEHVYDWRRAITNLKRVLRPGGVLLLTTRSRGFYVHGHPYDYWRYDIDDMRRIFADFRVVHLGPDPVDPGVFVLSVKPASWQPEPLDDIALYSVITRSRVIEVNRAQTLVFNIQYRIQRLARKMRRGWLATRKNGLREVIKSQVRSGRDGAR